MPISNKFDKVFLEDSGQEEVFTEMADMVQGALDGFKVFFYLLFSFLLIVFPSLDFQFRENFIYVPLLLKKSLKNM